ncbi:MAG: hypothetical protein GC160_02600 [Acidobacteria bacterium]|nr:hypothetical protein [Acidobacteriota bacterium]
MTFIVLVLLFTLAFGVLLAAELLRASADSRGHSTAEAVAGDRSISLEQLQRLLDDADGQYLQGHPSLARKHRQERRKVLRVYLQALRAEFLRVFGVCRLLAPVSRDPEFVSQLARSYAVFHSAYFLLWMSSWTGVSFSPAKLAGLSQAVRQIRAQADGLLHSDSALATSSSH